MSLSETGAGHGQGSAVLAPDGAISLGEALIERTALAIEAVVRRQEVADALYRSQVNEMFALSSDSSGFAWPGGSEVRAGTGGAGAVPPRQDL
jgi:hypothetical protein